MSKGKKAACYNAVVAYLKDRTTPASLQDIADATGYSKRMVRAQTLQDARNIGQQIQEVGGGFFLDNKTFKYETPAIVQKYDKSQTALAAITRAKVASAEALALAEDALRDSEDITLLDLIKKLK
jgi:biotin operon repressor